MAGSAMCAAGAPEDVAQPAASKESERAAKLEGNLVIHFVALETRRCLACAAPAAKAAAALTAPVAAIQHGQFTTEILQHDFGGVFLRAVLVSPFAGLELAFDIDLGALAKIFLRHIRQVLVEDHHPVPLGLFLALAAGLVAPALAGGDRKIDDG